MSKIGRNTPCPCGSGKKYKHCCLHQEQDHAAPQREDHRAVGIALDWLAQHYGEQIFTAVLKGFFDCGEHDVKEKMARVPGPLHEMVQININEWLLADAEIVINGRSLRTMDLILGAEGPSLSPQGRKHLETLAASALSFYEIQEVHRGKGVLVIDLLNETASPFFVYEVSATESLVQWDIIAARCMLQDGTYTFGGGVYPFSRDEALRCLVHLREKLKSKPEKESTRSLCTKAITSRWAEIIATPPEMPILLDQQTKELIAYTTDYYVVFDWQELERILLAQEDVEIEEDELVWTHCEAVDDQRYRPLARLERVVGKDRLRVECNTRGKADTARQWLEGLAGRLVRHTSRRSATPSQMLRAESKKKKKSNPPQQDAIPHELKQQILNEYLVRHYEEWPSIPLPALNGKTPLAAAKLKSLRPKLIDLLKQIEQGEARRAKEEGIQPIDLSFLWERLNIERAVGEI